MIEDNITGIGRLQIEFLSLRLYLDISVNCPTPSFLDITDVGYDFQLAFYLTM